MFIKIGDANPILSIIDSPDQLDDDLTKASLKKVIKSVKNKQQDASVQIDKELEKN